MGSKCKVCWSLFTTCLTYKRWSNVRYFIYNDTQLQFVMPLQRIHKVNVQLFSLNWSRVISLQGCWLSDTTAMHSSQCNAIAYKSDQRKTQKLPLIIKVAARNQLSLQGYCTASILAIPLLKNISSGQNKLLQENTSFYVVATNHQLWLSSQSIRSSDTYGQDIQFLP